MSCAQINSICRHLKHAVFLDSNSTNSDNHVDILTAEPVSFSKDKTDLIDEHTNFISNTLKLVSSASDNNGYPATFLPLPFTHGLVGYLSYDIGEYSELSLSTHKTFLDVHSESFPNCFVGFYSWSYVYEHSNKKGFITFSPFCDIQIRKKILNCINLPHLNKTKQSSNKSPALADLKWLRSQTFNDYASAFRDIQNYITMGDCYQVNLTQRFESASSYKAVDLYFESRQHIKTPYSCFFSFSDHQHLLSFSPEQFISINQRIIESKPIKGTIKNNGFKENEEQQLNSAKNHAENVMIVDLLRNDLGKVCKTHTVTVPELLKVESYKNVHHLVSKIRGYLKDDISEFEAFLSCFPGGSITGAPKIRSMEIIHELEKHKRSAYCGSVFYLNHDGRFDSNILIRSVIKNNDQLYCWAGGGITADSEVHDEYQESLTKVCNITGLDS